MSVVRMSYPVQRPMHSLRSRHRIPIVFSRVFGVFRGHYRCQPIRRRQSPMWRCGVAKGVAKLARDWVSRIREAWSSRGGLGFQSWGAPPFPHDCKNPRFSPVMEGWRQSWGARGHFSYLLWMLAKPGNLGEQKAVISPRRAGFPNLPAINLRQCATLFIPVR
jgi:hypothetical protein